MTDDVLLPRHDLPLRPNCARNVALSATSRAFFGVVVQEGIGSVVHEGIGSVVQEEVAT